MPQFPPTEMEPSGDDWSCSSKTLPNINLAKPVLTSWEHELFVDYTIQVEDKQFKVHKLIMASVSDYFKAMLTGGMMESREDTARLEGFSPLVVSNIIDYIYTRKISGPGAELTDFLACAIYLQIPQAIEAATHVLKQLINVKNCFELACTFKMYALNEAVRHTIDYIKSNMDKIQKECEIGKLPFEHFQIYCELWERSEWDLFIIIKDWVLRDYENRKQHLNSLMSHVQFGIMTAAEVEAVMSMDIYSDESWHDLVDAAEEYRNLPTHQKMMQTFRFRGNPTAACFHIDSSETFNVMQKNGDWNDNMEIKSTPIPVFENGIATCVEFNNFLLVCESYSSNQEWHVFDGHTFKWSTMTKMLTPKTDFALVHDGKESVYALGGRVNVGTDTESVTDLIEKYDVKTNTWSIWEATLPVPLQRHCACLYFGSIYVTGGWQTTDKSSLCSGRMDCLDLSTSSWQSKKAQLYTDPCKIMHQLEFDREQVIVTLDDQLRLQVYNPKTDRWILVKDATRFYNVFKFHPHSRVLASPRENALYLLNFNRDEWDEDDEDLDDAMCLGGCIKWTLKKDGQKVKEEGLQGCHMFESLLPGKDLKPIPYIAGVLAFPPASQQKPINPDAVTY